MAARIIDGKALAAERIDTVRQDIEALVAAGHDAPGLAVVLVGTDPASRVYVANKRRACDRAGIRSFSHDLPETTSEVELLELVRSLNDDPTVDGILVQLPLPDHIDPNRVTNSIDPEKDVDGFHAANVGHLALRQPGLRPCTPKGIMTLLYAADVDPKRQHCVMVGASNHVGRPMVLEMLHAGATVTCCHKFTQDLESHVRMADILVVAVGSRGIVDSEWIREGAVVVDVGIHRDVDGGLYGDVEFETARAKASAITPVPGGVGPMTVATLMENTLEAAQYRRKSTSTA